MGCFVVFCFFVVKHLLCLRIAQNKYHIKRNSNLKFFFFNKNKKNYKTIYFA